MQDDQASGWRSSWISRLGLTCLGVLYLTPAADLIDLAVVIPSMVAFWRLSVWFNQERSDRVGRVADCLATAMFVAFFTSGLNRVSGYGLDVEHGWGTLKLVFLLGVILVVLASMVLGAYALFRRRVRCILLLVMPLALVHIFDVTAHVVRQMVGKHVYEVDVKRSVVTKIPYGVGPITVTFDERIPIVDGIMLPHGSWHQDITMPEYMIHMFYEGE